VGAPLHSHGHKSTSTLWHAPALETLLHFGREKLAGRENLGGRKFKFGAAFFWRRPRLKFRGRGYE
jgi:hypothetical protein